LIGGHYAFALHDSGSARQPARMRGGGIRFSGNEYQ
jgi:hypothetical protein